MESIFNNIICLSKTYPFEGGIIGITLAISLLLGLIYLIINRNKVLTIPYGLTLLAIIIFLIFSILTLLITGIYGVTNWDKISARNFHSAFSKAILVLLLIIPILATAQGINYPANQPVNNGGAGNARNDADNHFVRNNLAALTDIKEDVGENNLGRLRFIAELHSTFYKYKRDWKPFGFNQSINSQDSIIVPSGGGEITYTTKSRKYAFGVGISQTFGFESKLKDDEKVLGNFATFYDTKIASNDITIGCAIRVNKKLSVGGAFIFGRGFLLQTAPIQQLAQLGIIRHSRLDVSKIGGAGASFSLHYRPTEKMNFGFNFKTARKYEMDGILDTIQPVVTPTGLQLVPIKLNVIVPLKLPFIVESGIKIEPSNRVFVDFNYRFYNYSGALDTLKINDKSSGSTIAANNINAKDVHLISIGGAYKFTSKSKAIFGFGYQNNAISDAAFSPALNNSGGISFSGGIAKKFSDVWINIGVTKIFAGNREISVNPQNLFPGSYRASGWTVGVGFRK